MLIFQSIANSKKLASIHSKIQKFKNSKIERITIPHHITSIGQNAFSFIKKLKKVDISKNSELKIIEKHAFASTSIKSLNQL